MRAGRWAATLTTCLSKLHTRRTSREDKPRTDGRKRTTSSSLPAQVGLTCFAGSSLRAWPDGTLSDAAFVLCEEYTNPPEHLRRPGSESIGLHIRVANGTIEVNDEVIDGSETTKKLICDYEWAKRYAKRYPDPQLRDQLMAEGLMRVEGEGDMSQLPQFWLDLDTISLIRPRTAW
jgi:hypothetical protein